MHLSPLSLILVALLGLPGIARAQGDPGAADSASLHAPAWVRGPTLGAGQRVRLWARVPASNGRRGTVLGASDRVLTLRDERTRTSLAVAWEHVHRLDISRGRRPAGRAFVRGALLGAAVGAVGGAYFGANSNYSLFGFGARRTAGTGATLGVGIGAGLGGLAGLLVRGDRWATVHPPADR